MSFGGPGSFPEYSRLWMCVVEEGGLSAPPLITEHGADGGTLGWSTSGGPSGELSVGQEERGEQWMPRPV